MTTDTNTQINRGDKLELTLSAWGRLGEALAYWNDREVFVSGGIPGEEVVAEIVAIRRKYIAAKVVQVTKASPARIDAPCQYYGACSGCQWQHVSYEAQLSAKQDRVIDSLFRVGGFINPNVLPVLPSPDQLGYRNHARFTIKEHGSLGFVNRETHRFVKIDTCMLMHPGINKLLGDLQGHCSETTQLSIRAGEDTGDYLVQPTLKSTDIPIVTGQKHYRDSIQGVEFRVASPSFFQVNNKQASNMALVVKDALNLKGTEVLLDAYAGVGTFAILLAPYASKVIAIEESSAAVADAKVNAENTHNVEFILGKTEEVLGDLDSVPDAVVLDPPRAGCQSPAIDSLLRLYPENVVYVSCDPDTLARDLKMLCSGAYSIDSIQPLDMFPQTHHVENIVILKKTTKSSDIVLASSSPRRRDLLRSLELSFDIKSPDIDETPMEQESAEDMVKRLSFQKALAIAGGVESGYVIGADSTVELEGRSYGKPIDSEDAIRMLKELSGTDHRVVTGVTVIEVDTGRYITDALKTSVSMRALSDEEIRGSVDSGTPMDKAGAYAVQDSDLEPASGIEGCYTNVIGLPLCRLISMLDELGSSFVSEITRESFCESICSNTQVSP
ncbi:MAG: 23S rRNA (uracil(1939)-C(5))-methyltransferase RlmD [SAR202 cluster bacterium]|nr:MAG: 23S rRNA (uracil(1939)-C(5))-methyltransferase RlmD [SAR202 cluster bacterium]